MVKVNKNDFALSSFKNIEKEKLSLANISSVIRSNRAQRGISRYTLAVKSNISLRYLAQLESGECNPTITVLKNIAYALNITLKNLLFSSNNRNSDKEFIKSKLDNYNESQIKDLLDLIKNIDDQNKKKINKNKIALIGLRGAGKSTLGNMYSKEYKIPLYEITNEIEKLGGMNISEIIELGGQGMYRRLEYTAIYRLQKIHKKLIILTGGSLVSERETFNFLLKNFFTIWIKANPIEHMNRVIKQGDLRPISSNPKAMDDLRNILKERESLYSRADVVVNTENQNKMKSYEIFKNSILK